MNVIKRAARAFIAGGCIGTLGQVMIRICGIFVPAEFSVLIAMLVFGAISSIVIIAGLYDPIAKFAANGAAIPVCGLMYGAAMQTAGEIRNGAKVSRAVGKGFAGVFKVLGTGFILAFILGLLLK